VRLDAWSPAGRWRHASTPLAMTTTPPARSPCG